VGGKITTANYNSGSGSNSLVFTYTTVTNDEDTDGVAVISPLVLNSGTIKDSAGNNAVLNFTGLVLSGVKVDAVAPVISSISLPTNKTYKPTETFTFTVNFSEPVEISGTVAPSLILMIGNSPKDANCTFGANPISTMICSYTTGTTDIDLDGISFGNSNELALNGRTIVDLRNNALTLSLGTNNMTKINVAPTNMAYWYDVSDPDFITTPTPTTLTVLKDKMASLDLTYSGTPAATYSSNGFINSKSSITCNTNQYFIGGNTTTTPKAVIAIMKAPTGAATRNYIMIDGTKTDKTNIIFSASTVGTFQYLSGSY
jgi:hypothetical protein